MCVCACAYMDILVQRSRSGGVIRACKWRRIDEIAHRLSMLLYRFNLCIDSCYDVQNDWFTQYVIIIFPVCMMM